MESNGLKVQAGRTVYFDYLRVFATFGVIILHISAQNWAVADVNSTTWQVFNFSDSIMRWSVPAFVMISGALFLNREVSLNDILSKYVLRMALSFLAWSMVYVLLLHDEPLLNKRIAFLSGHYHMWFIPMIIGLYLCIPFIRLFTSSSFIVRYYLVLSLLFSFLIPELIVLGKDFGGEWIVAEVKAIQTSVSNMNMYLVMGYASYFVLGHCLNQTGLTRRQRFLIYALGLLGFAMTIGLDLLVALKTQKSCSNYYGYITVNVLLESVAVFTWFNYHTFCHDKLNAIFRQLSKYSFGAYLIHPIIIEQLDQQFGLNTLSFSHPSFAIIFLGIVVFAGAFFLSAILNHIPIIKDYIV